MLTGGIKQLLGIGREERFAQIMQSMGQAFLYRRVCLVGAPIMAVSCILLLFYFRIVFLCSILHKI